MIYEYREFLIRWMNMERFEQNMKEFMRFMEKHGAKIVGAWTTEVGRRNTYSYILAFNDWAGREKCMKDLYLDKEFLEGLNAKVKREGPTVETEYRSIIRPTDYAPFFKD